MTMLDSFQISTVLLAYGLSRTPMKVDRTKAHGFKSTSLAHKIFVRVGGDRGSIHELTDDPLALHPDDADRVRHRHGELDGVKLRDSRNRNSAFSGFPQVLENGKTREPEAVFASVVDEEALAQLLSAMGHSTQAGAVVPATVSDQVLHTAAEAEIDLDPKNQNLGPTTRKALVDARLGQGGYRDRMRALWGDQCAVTGCPLVKALIASHALAWKDSEPHERLDEYNGLLLTASIDRLFDQGLISFDANGQLLCKPELSAVDLPSLGLHPAARLRFVHGNHLHYLAIHRQRFGF
jgi:hypothetical protein